jgi:hypothetical protein
MLIYHFKKLQLSLKHTVNTSQINFMTMCKICNYKFCYYTPHPVLLAYLRYRSNIQYKMRTLQSLGGKISWKATTVNTEMDIKNCLIFSWLQFHTFHSTVLFYDFLSRVSRYVLCQPLRSLPT